MSPATFQVLDRLDILLRNLEGEGAYVRANTVFLAIEEIRKGIEPIPDGQISQTLKEWAAKAFPSSTNNQYAMSDWTGRILSLMKCVPPDEYAALYYAIFPIEDEA